MTFHKVLKLDQKKMENIKFRFNEIKSNMNTSSGAQFRCNNSSCDATDIIESKEHFEILRLNNLKLKNYRYGHRNNTRSTSEIYLRK